ncbi:MAG TPA: DUF5680 domain-containing protein [Feifaniaceae bacterium]|nr:DUF5680 domain-containing protein [Feifaniaceae bacterium]
MKFHEKLQACRKEKELSQEKLAERLNVSRQAVAKWEAGQSYPDVDRLLDLSDLFQTSVDQLLRDRAEDSCVYRNAGDPAEADAAVIDFLCRAKQNTFSGHGATCAPSRPSSHDYRFEEGDLMYYDTYLGGERFAGEEAIFRGGAPLWAMNYTGRILAEQYQEGFLCEALMRVPKEYPFRGPLVYRNGRYTYHCVVNGEFSWFNGYEEIFCGDTKVYECVFHGGGVR